MQAFDDEKGCKVNSLAKAPTCTDIGPPLTCTDAALNGGD